MAAGGIRVSDLDKLHRLFPYPYQALLDQAIHNSATSAFRVSQLVSSFDTALWQNFADVHREIEANRKARADMELLRQMTAMRHMGRDMEAMRQLSRDMEAMGQLNRDVEITRQGSAKEVRQDVAENIARAQAAQKQVADALLLRQHDRNDPQGTPQDNTNDAADPSAEAKRTIEIPPGATLLAWAQAWCSAKTVELLVEPIIADYRHEIFEALSHGRGNAAIRAIHVRYRTSFVVAVLCNIAGMIGRIIKAARGA